MDNLYADVFFFFVPNRLVWDDWQKFCGEQVDPGDSTDYTMPQWSSAGGFSRKALADYMGIPVGKTNLSVSALPARGYSLVWNEWFRDQNIQNSITVPRDAGPDGQSEHAVQRRGKRHDYFTSCLPWPSKGPGVELPLGETAAVVGTGAPTFDVDDVTGGTLGTAGGVARVDWSATPTGADATAIWNDPKLEVDLASATAATINSLREAFQLQKLFERDARGGTRYVEIVKSHFGVTSPDARLQRPEFLGGGSMPVIFNPIVQTTQQTSAASWETTPKGTLAAFATAARSGIGYTKSFVEHGTVLGLISVRADLTYQQSLNRMWSRSTRYDFYWPALAHLGEQAVLNKEIWAQGPDVLDGGDIVDDQVFGYQERWAEYRYKPSLVTGQFRSTDPAPLDAWHLAQEFQALPTLDSTFIVENPPVSRVVYDNTEPELIMDAYLDIQAARPMPTYSVPGLIDHF